MGDPGFIPAFIGYAIQLAGHQIIRHINVAVRCRKELDTLKLVLPRIEAMNAELQEYRKALNSGRVSASPHHPLPSTVNTWLNELNLLLEEASVLAQHCSVPSYSHLFSRYTLSKKIRQVTASLEKHLASTPSVAFLHQLQQHLDNRQVLQHIKERINSLNLRTLPLAGTSSGTSGDLFPSTSSAPSNNKYIEETLIVGQDSASTRLEELIHSEQDKKFSRFGLVGKGGAGKTLLLKRIFNSNQVQNRFCNGLMIWLTVSQNPSFNALRSDLARQIALNVDERLQSREEDHVKTWLNESMAKHKFALFLDDVWETSASSLLEELCVPLFPHHNSNIIIATSRSTSVLLKLGVLPSSLIQMQDLTEDDSWSLFSFHAFPHSEGKLPLSIDQEIAKHVCKECGGLPLALKVIGHAMAGITRSDEWEFTLHRLQNDVIGTLSSRLRLSYDALADVPGYGISLQLCFLCLAAFPEDYAISTFTATMHWIGEGLVAGMNALQIGEIYLNLLADRCLIEPLQKDYDGKVIFFRVHDVLHDLAHQIAEKEEKCFFQAGRGLPGFPVLDQCSGHVRISLMDNSLTSIPKAFTAPYIRSLLLAKNPYLTEIPKEVIGSMTALRVLDLSFTAIQSFPKSLGCLKHLVCLILFSVPIKRLPNSIAALKNLQILDLYGSDITQLPSDISKLTSLKLLVLGSCIHLQCMPYGISHLTSLEYLDVSGCSNIGWNKCGKNRISISDLGTLNQLKRFGLRNNGEIIREGTLGRMKQMEYLRLALTGMERLPHDMTAMSKLRKLCLECPKLLEIQNSFCEFQHLSYIKLVNCLILERLPALHKLPSLKQLIIKNCPNIEKFPEEFGKAGGFPKLEVFSVVKLRMLEQLPLLQEGALPSLRILTMMKCEALQRLPQCYWNLKIIEKVRVYDCPKVQLVMAEEENLIKSQSKVQTVTLSTTETQALEKRFFDMFYLSEYNHYGDFWSNEMFQVLDDINIFRLL
ncbi:hypothetical protein SUGI_0529430 [Cryptomeria japonica]|uniref:probable disease resistance protein At4g27220 n=1 Tax=Cryptomeria japonica TaxID=3369 RepID=UPI002408C0CA|nr:probable disease resistance protein At4g27220 [Cryptomeria japonica]GLJ27014.1 hypothetical protein SUGI_0529430 [Cryptomeria japonica]